MKTGRQGEAGQIIIETLLLLMLLLAMVCTFIEVCLIAIEKHEVDRIARYAARAWSVHQTPEWDPDYALGRASEFRLGSETGRFYQLQSQIGQASESSRTDPNDGTLRSGLQFRTYIPLLMPLTEEFVGWQVDPPDSELLKNPGWLPITPEEIQTLKSFGVRKVVLSETFIPMDKEPAEGDHSKYDNDYPED